MVRLKEVVFIHLVARFSLPMNEDPAPFLQIQRMFSAIAPRYDFLNRLLSCGQDQYWRKAAVNCLAPKAGDYFLDLATGTADIALEIAARDPLNIKVVGVDLSYAMLQLGKKKIRSRNLEKTINLQTGVAEHLAFADKTFDGVISAFGVRNFSNIERGLQEMLRVLKSKGRIVILEFSLPKNPLLSAGYRVYFDYFLPLIGRAVSGHHFAYRYLPESVSAFPSPSEFIKVMESNGFENVMYKNLTLGIATIYTGYKHV